MWAVAECCFMASNLSQFHWWETAVATRLQPINLRADVKLFAIPPAWGNNEEEKRRAFGVCTKENVFLTYAMMYTLGWPSLKFSLRFKEDATAVEPRLFFTLTVRWADCSLLPSRLSAVWREVLKWDHCRRPFTLACPARMKSKIFMVMMLLQFCL